MQELMPVAEQVAQVLIARHESLGVAESSAGGLISAALLAVPGASAYFLGGGVIYTRTARAALLDLPEAALAATRASTEAYALLLAGAVRGRLGSTWGVAESGASGPTGNRYGDPAGHACLGVVGPHVSRARTIETGSSDRQANMHAFAGAALGLLAESLRHC